MGLWFRNRAGWVAIVSGWAAAALCVPGMGFLVAFPNLTGAPGIAAPASALLPLLGVLGWAYSASRQNTLMESMSIRRPWTYDLLLAAACVAPFVVVAMALRDADAIAAARNATGYYAAALASSWLVGLRLCGLIPLIWAIASCMGLVPASIPSLSWPLAPTTSAVSWALPAFLSLVAPFGYLNRQRNRLARSQQDVRG